MARPDQIVGRLDKLYAKRKDLDKQIVATEKELVSATAKPAAAKKPAVVSRGKKPAAQKVAVKAPRGAKPGAKKPGRKPGAKV
jgi:cell division septation protein DedD